MKIEGNGGYRGRWLGMEKKKPHWLGLSVGYLGRRELCLVSV
jgi:hypothetical protein